MMGKLKLLRQTFIFLPTHNVHGRTKVKNVTFHVAHIHAILYYTLYNIYTHNIIYIIYTMQYLWQLARLTLIVNDPLVSVVVGPISWPTNL